ncbi:response regulator [Haloarcula sp. JP-L23]|uniref:response regulator n=1 Tax=Haloarcula sp. JP-L23 TaxID=2716717 RepID=UPI00140F05A5|nr:response regulator [Haloarcula sp. JP-L23]
MNDSTEDDQTKTVLIVDDETGLADLYAAYLEDHYETRTAYNGDEALEMMDDEVDILLLDRRMPRQSGGEVMTNLRERGYDQPVAMLTAVDPGNDILDLAIDDYFVKPIDQAELREAVSSLAARIQYDREFREYFAMVSKKATMEANMSDQELASSDAYQTLKESTITAREETDTALTEMMVTDAVAGFRDL